MKSVNILGNNEIMITQILNDVKEGHYLWMRKKNDTSVARIANFGIIFITLFVYYSAFFIIISELVYKYIKNRDGYISLSTNILIIFGPYLVFYFLFVYPNLKRKINEHISEIEKKRKKKVATIYFIFCALALPIAGIIINILNGH